jgi:hypothetical protein
MDESNDNGPQPLKLSYAATASEARWVTLGKYIPLEAQLIQVKLRGEGIPCNLADQNMAQMYSGLIGIDVRVEVLSDDLERARAILEEARVAREKNAQEEPYLDEDWRCSKCRSKNVSHVPLSPPMVVLTLLLLGLPLLFITRYRICHDCGHTWQD